MMYGGVDLHYTISLLLKVTGLRRINLNKVVKNLLTLCLVGNKYAALAFGVGSKEGN